MGVKSGSSERAVPGEDGQQQPLTPVSVLLLLPFCDSRGTEADMLVLRYYCKYWTGNITVA